MSTDTSDIPNRPTPEHLASLFPKHGLEPTTGAYFTLIQGRLCGCEIAAMLADAAGGVAAAMALHAYPARYGMRSEVAARTGLPEEYLRGIDLGFTWGSMPSYPAGPPAFMAGLADGVAARRIVFGKPEAHP